MWVKMLIKMWAKGCRLGKASKLALKLLSVMAEELRLRWV